MNKNTVLVSKCDRNYVLQCRRKCRLAVSSSQSCHPSAHAPQREHSKGTCLQAGLMDMAGKPPASKLYLLAC